MTVTLSGFPATVTGTLHQFQYYLQIQSRQAIVAKTNYFRAKKNFIGSDKMASVRFNASPWGQVTFDFTNDLFAPLTLNGRDQNPDAVTALYLYRAPFPGHLAPPQNSVQSTEARDTDCTFSVNDQIVKDPIAQISPPQGDSIQDEDIPERNDDCMDDLMDFETTDLLSGADDGRWLENYVASYNCDELENGQNFGPSLNRDLPIDSVNHELTSQIFCDSYDSIERYSIPIHEKSLDDEANVLSPASPLPPSSGYSPSFLEHVSYQTTTENANSVKNTHVPTTPQYSVLEHQNFLGNIGVADVFKDRGGYQTLCEDTETTTMEMAKNISPLPSLNPQISNFRQMEPVEEQITSEKVLETFFSNETRV